MRPKKREKKKKCLLVSSDTPHPSGSIPPINLAQLAISAEVPPATDMIKSSQIAPETGDAEETEALTQAQQRYFDL